MKSLKELFRTGHGPSSSHTMAPCRAAEMFLRKHPDAAGFEVTLFGSLAATGKGHFTDRAIASVLSDERTRIVWKPDVFLPEHPNGMFFRAMDDSGSVIGEWKAFSVGGGAVSEDGRQEETPECYPFRSMDEVLKTCEDRGVPLWQLVEESEGTAWLGDIYDRMMKTLDEGLAKEGVLPGGLHLERKARSFFLKARALRKDIRRPGIIAAYAYAVCEENASLGTVVTAPTCGSCGVLPAVLRYIQETHKNTRADMSRALAVAGLIGNVVKMNGSISGAEVGCQGEVGTACAMAAAAAAWLFGGTPRQCEYAAEIGLEHFLGLTCDPVLGLVQIPCIERNAIAANRAVVAAELALISDGRHMISFDDVVRAMLATGHDLPGLYRETSLGGLARVMKGR
ncbi:MAG: L-serine ammonia-lyase, iron-sulfur-dependent, subunit alpha [Lentisphaeria bacterium]|nr:L-serine ammonia-lyase, iron-sulfur-dependent, subunit alpha [Lentisphaeria bacterium]